MAVYSRREVVTKRVEYFVPSPTNWAEVGKVMSAITAEVRKLWDGRDGDDTVTVGARDDEIVFSFEVES